MAKLELFAMNLINPSHMEWTKDGRLLVAEHTSGRIKDITKGGDMLKADPLVEGLNGPAAILPINKNVILVNEVWSGTIRKLTLTNGEVKSSVLTKGLSLPYGMAKCDSRRRIHISEKIGSHAGQITEIDPKSGAAAKEPYVYNLPAAPGMPGLTPIKSWPNNWEKFAAAGCITDWPTSGIGRNLYTTIGLMGQILDITKGGDYFDLIKKDKLIAWGLHRIGGMHYNRNDNCIYAVEPEAGSVVKVDVKRKQNYKFSPRVVQGLNFPTCPRFGDNGKTLYICSSGDGVVWKLTNF